MSIHFKTILESLSKIEEKASIVYKNIALGDSTAFPQTIRNIAKVFAIEEMKHHAFYNELLASLDPNHNIEIFDETYLIILGEIKILKEKLARQNLIDSQNIIQYAFDIEVLNISILQKINELILKDNPDIPLAVKSSLLQLIKEEEKHAENLKRYL